MDRQDPQNFTCSRSLETAETVRFFKISTSRRDTFINVVKKSTVAGQDAQQTSPKRYSRLENNLSNMFNPLNCGHGRKRRTHYMLAPGGRVVRADHDPRTTNRLMVPTESELKAMLYDQVP